MLLLKNQIGFGGRLDEGQAQNPPALLGEQLSALEGRTPARKPHDSLPT